MSTGLQYLDGAFPSLNEDMSSDEKIEELFSKVVLMLESMKYLLTNLGTSNFNSTELSKITGPIIGQISDVQKNLMEIKITADSASLTASNALGQSQILQLTVDGLTITSSETGETLINGSKIITKDIEGVSFVSQKREDGILTGDSVTIEDGEISIVGASSGSGIIKGSVSGIEIANNSWTGTLLKLLSIYGRVEIQGAVTKMNADTNASIDAGAGYKIFIGTSNDGENIDIGNAGGTVNLIGTVLHNGVPI